VAMASLARTKAHSHTTSGPVRVVCAPRCEARGPVTSTHTLPPRPSPPPHASRLTRSARRTRPPPARPRPTCARRGPCRTPPSPAHHTAITRVRCLCLEPAPECSSLRQRPLTLCAAFTASRLGANSIGGYYNDDREFVSNTDGIIALCEGLKGSAVTSLECAAAPKCLPFCQRPLTRLLSHYPHPTPRSQSPRQHNRRPGRLRARCRPQGDEDHPSRVRCCPIVFAFVHCQRPLTHAPAISLPPSLTVSDSMTSEPRAPPRSPPSSRIRRSPTWSAPPPECSRLCQCPLTCSLSHHRYPTPRSQSLQQ
jgi:hypothetical protein